ncbi:hypothetical protein BCR24_10480 [Enterococcus ureilyticus]|uniref:Uncharacterized protein n=1 Tax=Enterococcus ureilyticus TaxID=1131292 RepID=A0A1E5HFK8_9ENTE|nr:hypothetical protein [Enterococcus ureilyticus]MBM7689416.1 putative Holliday junction resolvase-like endonuclease [Enterococcus ureilyticus]MBO0444858.1 hypothetical protein [Enterococcus ureilyticus]OEG23729.1 hypothetical protein BCR24_10480 [Enterococcus ureilyticus]
MDRNLLIVLYFFVVVIVVLTLVIVRDKQFLRSLLGKKEVQQEEITDLKLEKIRLKHIIKMQDETISHMLSSTQYIKPMKIEPNEANQETEWHLDEYTSMNREYHEL